MYKIPYISSSKFKKGDFLYYKEKDCLGVVVNRYYSKINSNKKTFNFKKRWFYDLEFRILADDFKPLHPKIISENNFVYLFVPEQNLVDVSDYLNIREEN